MTLGGVCVCVMFHVYELFSEIQHTHTQPRLRALDVLLAVVAVICYVYCVCARVCVCSCAAIFRRGSAVLTRRHRHKTHNTNTEHDALLRWLQKAHSANCKRLINRAFHSFVARCTLAREIAPMLRNSSDDDDASQRQLN